MDLTTAAFVEVFTGDIYPEDARLNDQADTAGEMPGLHGAAWQARINLVTGQVLDWPLGVVARLHYKVRDEGVYWLLDAAGHRIARWIDPYVPHSLLCPEPGNSGWGDYLIMSIDAEGFIKDWRGPSVLIAEEWSPVGKLAPRSA